MKCYFWEKRRNMSDPMLNTLIELFPDVSEEFLSGIYDAHKDEEVDIEELIEVILSFELKPLRETVNEHNQNINGSIDIDQEFLEPPVSSITDDTNVNRPVNDEVLQKSAPLTVDELPSSSVDHLLEKCSAVKQSVETVQSTSNPKLRNESVINYNDSSDTPKIEIKRSSDSGLELSTNLVVRNDCIDLTRVNNDLINTNCSINHDQSDEYLDSSPECSIKFLMMEGNIMERDNITTDLEKLTESPEEDKELASYDSKLNNDSLLVAFNNQALTNNRILHTKTKKNNVPRKRSACLSISQNTTCQASHHSSTKRVTLRSCKVKNEEERLRRRLVVQSRLFHEMKVNNVNPTSGTSQFLDMDKKYSLLCNIFPDADPAYLLRQCEFLTDQEKILVFISQHLELRDYPKIEVLNEEPEPKLTEFHCTVLEFIEVIPDPVAEFSSANYVRVGYENNAEIYIKARYNLTSDDDAKQRLTANGYNLTAVCTQLEEEGWVPTPGVLDYTPLHHPSNIMFDQEVWYIEHRKEVHDYLDSAIEAIRMQEELDRQPPPPPPEEVFECEICTEEIVEYINIGTCDGPTGHLFCLNCIKRSVEVRIGDGATNFPCLVNCGYFIPLQTVEELLPPDVFSKLMGRIQEEEVRKANIAGVETCPFCPYAYGPGEDGPLFVCANPQCQKISCRLCRKEDHSPEVCEMLKNEDEERARHIIEEKMAEALMRTCHSCGKNFVKTTGCNKMTCTCGAKMCYVCRQPVQDYEHFNGPGGDNTGRCPLFSEFDELHDRPVETTAEEVFNQIAANNPHLNLDRAKLIPK